MDVLNMILPIVYIVVGVALVWFVVELALTIRKARSTVDDVQKQIAPTLANVEQLTEDAKPLVERASLTMDAANLEIMRVDEILQDVGQITDTAARAVSTVDNVANAPMDLVNSITSKVRSKLAPKQASDVSKQMGEAKGAAREEAEAAASRGIDDDAEPVNEGYTAVKAEAAAPESAEVPAG